MERNPVEPLAREAVEVLRTILERNASGVRPTRTELSRLIGVSQPTIRRKVAGLVQAGYLIQTRRGRTVLVEVTEAGRRALGL